MNDPSLSAAASWETNGSPDAASPPYRPRRSALTLLPPAGPVRVRALAVVLVPLLLVAVPVAVSAVSGGGSGAGAGTQVQQVGGQPANVSGGVPLFPPATTGEPSAEPSPTVPLGDPGVGSPTATDPFATTTPTPSSTDTPSAPTDTPSGDPTRPDNVVQNYFAAINSGHFRTAWNLGGRSFGGSYAAFAAGFADTVRDTVTVVSVEGDSVAVTLVSLQSNGTQHSYSGSYTVVDGVITSATVRQTG